MVWSTSASLKSRSLPLFNIRLVYRNVHRLSNESNQFFRLLSFSCRYAHICTHLPTRTVVHMWACVAHARTCPRAPTGAARTHIDWRMKKALLQNKTPVFSLQFPYLFSINEQLTMRFLCYHTESEQDLHRIGFRSNELLSPFRSRFLHFGSH